MSFDEFCVLLAGLNGDTPLGNVVQIRSETDRAVTDRFTPEQRRIRAEWRRFRAQNISANTDRAEYEAAMKGFADMFRGMAGKGGR